MFTHSLTVGIGAVTHAKTQLIEPALLETRDTIELADASLAEPDDLNWLRSRSGRRLVAQVRL
ncbi:hypothetical protein [Synechococcus sp. MIT S9510]|uniref:hypothetical protein n=1 Tax=Synechococcus sp. MIT S9510 TaxID=3082548 RepID=UPI0039B1091C